MKTHALATSIFFALTMFCFAETLQWRDARDLTVEGKGWTDTKEFYDRLPARAEKMVRPPVWSLSRDSAGMVIRFVSDAREISARWTLRKEALSMVHMSAIGVSGLDLYVKDGKGWNWVGVGRPKGATNEAVLVKDLKPGTHEFALYLPLYNGVRDVQVGVTSAAKLESAPVRKQKPILFYGTSILQGACASRPGMAHTAILGRKLNWPTINLGFSGNALSEPELAQLLGEKDPAVYVIDPIPNMTNKLVKERIEPFVKTLRAAHPKTPIVLVESLPYTDGEFVPPRGERYKSSNAEMRAAYERLKKTENDLFYVSCENLIGKDNEATVDGTHPNDLGFMRMAEVLEPVLRKALARSSR
jgi:lysophospholipase L1-like esterase